MSPGDLSQKIGIPKYKALSIVSCLSELGLLEPLYVKGSYKIYRISYIGKRFLERASNASIVDVMNELLSQQGSQVDGSPAPQQASSTAQ